MIKSPDQPTKLEERLPIEDVKSVQSLKEMIRRKIAEQAQLNRKFSEMRLSGSDLTIVFKKKN